MKSVALLEAIRKAGSVTKLAELIGVTPQAISQWEQAPINRVLAIERETRVKRHDLRPDFWPPPRSRTKRPPESATPPPVTESVA